MINKYMSICAKYYKVKGTKTQYQIFENLRSIAEGELDSNKQRI
jgi:hypothetical protein